MAHSSKETVPRFGWSGTYKDLMNAFNDTVDEDVITDIVLHHNNNLPLAYEDLCEIATGIGKPSYHQQDAHLSFDEGKNEINTNINSSNHIDGFNWERLSKNESPINRILYLVSKHCKVMVIMRGCPGSGKSYQATNILNRCYENADLNEFIFSADKFFTDKRTGNYHFDKSKLTAAHQWTYDNVQKAIFQEVTPVIVDNTNVQAWEMEWYVKLGVNYGYWLEIVEPSTEWAWNGMELSKKSIHKISLNKIMLYLSQYEHNITTDSLLTRFKLKYTWKNQPPLLSKRSINYKLCENIIENQKVSNDSSTNFHFFHDSFKDLHVSPMEKNNSTNLKHNTNLNNSDKDPWVVDMIEEKEIPTTNEPNNNDSSDVDEESQSISSTEGASNYVHKSVNTCENDLLFMGILNELPEEEYRSYVVFGKHRDINEGSIDVLSVPCGKLDKGTTTCDLRKVVCKPNIEELRKQFPEDVCLLIIELFEKCEGDIDWIVDMLVELGYDVSKQILHSLFQPKENNYDTIVSNSKNTINESNIDSNLLFPCFSPKLKVVKSVKNKIVAETYCKKKYSKKLLDPEAKEFSITNNDLRKKIENKFTFSDSLYSEHVLKIKKMKDNQSMLNCDNDTLPLQIESVNVDSENHDEEKFMQLVVDPMVLTQLCDYFGDFSSGISKSTLPMSVKLPEKLAEDLYYCLIANVPSDVFDQETILKDEILARKLQEDFKEECVPNNENACASEDSFAAVLSKKLLLEKFKHLDSQLVMKVFRANEYKLEKASDVLSAASNIGCLTNNTLDTVDEESCVGEDKYDDLNSNQNYRQEALEHSHMRQQYLNKANQSLSTKIHPSVTGYYLEKAEESKQNEKYANTKALIDIVKSNENSATLDLHYLQVQEAILILDLYLDEHISKLKKFNSGYSRGRQLTIITGRGKHSPKGVCRIKPAVVRRLQFRQLALLEPSSKGLIMVIIKKSSLLSSEL